MNIVALDGFANRLNIHDFKRRDGSDGRMARFNLAYSVYGGKDDEGNNKYDRGYIDCVIWSEPLIRRIEDLIPPPDSDRDGLLISIQGDFSPNTYEDNEGKRRYVNQVRVNELNLIERMTSQSRNTSSRQSGGERF